MFQYSCPHCEYQVRVVGGADNGVNCAVQTIVCLDCRKLFDVFTRLRLREGGEEASSQGNKTKSNRKLLPTGIVIPPIHLMENSWNDYSPGRQISAPVQKKYWTDVKLACPIANYHRIEVWNWPGRCPRCGTHLESNGFPFRLWD